MSLALLDLLGLALPDDLDADLRPFDERSADLGVERERGEHASFGGERLCFLRGKEGGDGLRLTLEIHAHEETFEIPLIGGADLYRLAAAIRGDRPFERRAGETHQRAEGGRPLGGRFTESPDGGGADFRVRIGGECGERFVLRRPDTEVAKGIHRFATDVAIGVGQQTHGQRSDLTSMLAQHPEGLDAAGGGRGDVTGASAQTGTATPASKAPNTNRRLTALPKPEPANLGTAEGKVLD